MVALISERRRLLASAALVLAAALVASCGSGPSGPKLTPTASPAAMATAATPAETAEATRTEAQAVATYFQIREDETPVTPNISMLTFVDAKNGWATNACEDLAPGFPICDILVTTDGGKTWRLQHRNLSRLGELHFLDKKTGFDIVSPNSILLTADGGVTWQSVGGDGPKGIDNTTFVPPTTGFALASGIIFQLNDEKKVWLFNYGNPDCSFMSLTFLTAKVGWAGGQGPAGPCLFKTTDGGETWEPSFLGADSPSVASAFLQSTMFRWLARPAERLSQFNRNCFLNSIDFYNARQARLSVACDHMGEGITLASEDRGASWQFASEQHDCLMGCQTQIYQAGASQQTYYLDLDHAWQRTRHQEVSWSVDGGKTWNKVSGPELCCDADSIFFVDPDHGWIPFGNSLAITTNGGRTWKRVPVKIVP